MKYYKRLELFKASNVTYNPLTKEAYSYNWWQFSRKVGNKILFNYTTYSNSTSKHQSKVMSQIRATFDRDNTIVFTLRDTVNMKNLSDKELIERIISDYNKNIQDLLAHNAKPRVRQKTKEYNLERIQDIKKDIAELTSFYSDLCFDHELKTLLEDNAA